MSELKAYIGPAPDEKGLADYYLKSEADKVIAEKDEAIAELKEQVHDYAQCLYVIQARAEKELRHSNHKRCLAMAKAYHEKSERMYCEASTAKSLNEIIGKVPNDFVVEKFELWGAIASTHRKIWLALAEEPTWAKFLQLIHKEAK